MNDSTTFCVFGREIPSELVEPLIKHLCERMEDWTFSLNREEILVAALIAIK